MIVEPGLHRAAPRLAVFGPPVFRSLPTGGP